MKLIAAVFLLGLVASSSAAGGRALQSDDLLSDAQKIIGGAISSVESGLSGIINGLFGAANSWATQIPSNAKDLSWDSLQNLDFTSPVKDFVSSIKEKTLAKDVLAAGDKVTEFMDQFCTPAEFTPSEKIPSNCVGKQLAVKLMPWQCALLKNKTIACTPPYIEVIKTPAVCTAKYHAAATFTGKECKLQKKIGDYLVKTIGGDPFSIDISKNLLNIPHDIATSLLPGKFDSETSFSASGAASISADDSNGVSVSTSGAVATGGK